MASREFRHGLVAEFVTADELSAAVRRLREQGYRDLDAFAPYDVPGLDRALALPRSRLPLVVLVAGIAGAAAGYWIQWWTNAVDYPLNAGGRPAHAVPSFIWPTFEGMVLTAAVIAVLAFLAMLRLPRLWHPVFEVAGFDRASTDRFWVGVDARDPRFHPAATASALRALAPQRVLWVEGGQ